MKRLYIFLSAVAMAALMGLGCTKSEPKSPQANLGTLSPKSEALPGITAKKLKDVIAASKKPTVVNLWATWCEPCKVELPEFKKFRDSEAGTSVNLVFISADSEADQASAAQFLKTVGLDGPNTYRLAENADEFGKILAPTWSATLPATFITDGEGNLKTFWIGETNQKLLEAKVAKALAAKR